MTSLPPSHTHLDIPEFNTPPSNDMRSSSVRKTVLVTGGLGYIGSHTVVELLLSDLAIDVLVLDNLCNSSTDVLDDIKHTVSLCADPSTDIGSLHFVEADVTDQDAMRNVFGRSFCQGRPISAVIHFAALKSVTESIDQPLRYYRENMGGLMTVLETMNDWGCKQIIFSSSATVYGSMSKGKCVESLCRHVTDGKEQGLYGVQGNVGLSNPYGRSKWMCEAMLHDVCVADSNFKAIALRYFNPIGAHPVGHLRESPLGTPTNLLPCITTAIEKGSVINIYGTDYDTPDGTAIRDFIHVVDLAQGHVAALRKLFRDEEMASHSTSAPEPEFPWFRRGSNSNSNNSSNNNSSLNLSLASDYESCYNSSEESLEEIAPETPPTPSSDLFLFGGHNVSDMQTNQLQVFNLGTGHGKTVREVLSAMRLASRLPIPVRHADRRAGDIESSIADPSKANTQLGWFAQRTLADACTDICRQLQLG